MINYLVSENLKYKRTFSRKLPLIAPLFFVLYALFTQLTIQSDANYFVTMVFNWWPLIFLPFGLAIWCSLSIAKERKAGNYRGLLSRDISLKNLWYSKIVTVAFYALISSLFLIMAVACINRFAFADNVPISLICKAGLAAWLVSTSLIPLNLLLASLLGTVGTLGVNLAGLFLGVIAAPNAIWIAVPWSWALRLMCPIVGVHPNGVPLQSGDPLLNPAVIWQGILAALVFLSLASLITAELFKRKEVL